MHTIYPNRSRNIHWNLPCLQKKVLHYAEDHTYFVNMSILRISAWPTLNTLPKVMEIPTKAMSVFVFIIFIDILKSTLHVWNINLFLIHIFFDLFHFKFFRCIEQGTYWHNIISRNECINGQPMVNRGLCIIERKTWTFSW